MSTRRLSRLPAINGALALIVILVVAQMWLLTTTLEADLAGQEGAAAPGALVSAILLAACALLGLLVGRVDRADRVDRAG